MTPVISAATKLSVNILQMQGRGRAKTVSNVAIKAGNVPVACAVLGGNYTESQVLTELRRLPKRFKLLEGYEIAHALKLC